MQAPPTASGAMGMIEPMLQERQTPVYCHGEPAKEANLMATVIEESGRDALFESLAHWTVYIAGGALAVIVVLFMLLYATGIVYNVLRHRNNQ